MLGNSLDVFLNDKHIGILEKDGNGGVIFQYLTNADRILSLSLYFVSAIALPIQILFGCRSKPINILISSSVRQVLYSFTETYL